MVESDEALRVVLIHLTVLAGLTLVLIAPPVRKRLELRTVAVLLLVLGVLVTLVTGFIFIG